MYHLDTAQKQAPLWLSRRSDFRATFTPNWLDLESSADRNSINPKCCLSDLSRFMGSHVKIFMYTGIRGRNNMPRKSKVQARLVRHRTRFVWVRAQISRDLWTENLVFLFKSSLSCNADLAWAKLNMSVRVQTDREHCVGLCACPSSTS